MRHKRLIIALTWLVFAAICLICMNELFSVKDITVNYSVTTEASAEEVLSLLEKYKGESMFVVDGQKIKDEITQNRYLKVVSVQKKYPNEIVVNLIERSERYYYEASDGWYFFDEEYFVIRRDDVAPVNTAGLTEIKFENIDGDDYIVDCSLKSFFEFPNQLNSQVDSCFEAGYLLKDNISTISFIFTAQEGNYRVRMDMVEGVIVEIREANRDFSDKIKAGQDFYLNLEESRKISGVVLVYNDANGAIKVNHTFND